MSARRVFSTLVAILAAATALTGCAGNGAGPSTGGGISYAGSYSAAFTLDAGKTGDLSLAVAPDSSVSGSLVVKGAPAAPSGRAGGFSFTVGSLTVTGSIANGILNLMGTDPNAGGFTITGSLPVKAGDNTVLTLTAGGTSYTAQCLVSQGSGSGSLTFVNNGASINSAAFPAAPYVAMSTVGGDTAIVAVPSVSDTSRSFSILMNASASSGMTIDLATSKAISMGYFEQSTGFNWNAVSGSVQIVSRTDSGFSLKFTDIVFTSTDSSGSFKVNGALSK